MKTRKALLSILSVLVVSGAFGLYNFTALAELNEAFSGKLWLVGLVLALLLLIGASDFRKRPEYNTIPARRGRKAKERLELAA